MAIFDLIGPSHGFRIGGILGLPKRPSAVQERIQDGGLANSGSTSLKRFRERKEGHVIGRRAMSHRKKEPANQAQQIKATRHFTFTAIVPSDPRVYLVP